MRGSIGGDFIGALDDCGSATELHGCLFGFLYYCSNVMGGMGQQALAIGGSLWFGDNLEVLQRHVDDASVDLVYLDPPFNSNRSYNVLFAQRDGRKAASQVRAFDDTWTWDEAAAWTYEEVVSRGDDVADSLVAMRQILGTSDMLAYLAMMTPRLVELHRVLKSTGSLYLHCDPTASHYLKIMLDAVFGLGRFEAEIVWKRAAAHSLSKGWDTTHDVLLCYSRSEQARFSRQYEPYSDEYVARFKRSDPDGRRWQDIALTGGGSKASPNARSQQAWRGHVPPPGRNWSAPRFITDALGLARDVDVIEKLDAMDAAGYIYWPSNGGLPRVKQYLDMLPGVAVGDVWTDISPINARAAERLGYPTQKPLALMERIIETSSRPGDVVLDPFCGCGTTIDAAQAMGRSWIGIDVTEVSVRIIRERLQKKYGQLDVRFGGQPASVDDAEALARLDKHEFQLWACRTIGVQNPPTKKGADRGIDGVLTGAYENGDRWKGLVSVKGGGVNVAQVRDLLGTVQRENADFGVFVTLKPPSKPMRREAADAGFTAEGVPRLQILTIADVMDYEKLPQVPSRSARPAPVKAERRRLRAV